MGVYLKWFGLTILDYILLFFTLLPVAIVVSLFTKEEGYDKKNADKEYGWGGWWGTYDNPPEGDQGFVTERCLFPNKTKGVKGYLNRVHWMLRNPLYGFQRFAAVDYKDDLVFETVGNENISDKYKVPGYYFTKVKRKGKLYAFEFYMVKPYSKSRCIRIRLGYKVLTDKYERFGFAQLVDTINPFKKYGK